MRVVQFQQTFQPGKKKKSQITVWTCSSGDRFTVLSRKDQSFYL